MARVTRLWGLALPVYPEILRCVNKKTEGGKGVGVSGPGLLDKHGKVEFVGLREWERGRPGRDCAYSVICEVDHQPEKA